MRISRASLEDCAQATGTVVVIDVLRAFTTAAFAFAGGAQEIILVGKVEEALALKEQWPEALFIGEVAGRPIKGFDFGNSPAAVAGVNLSGRRLIQRTTHGTQGVVRSVRAETILAGSFCCAQATVDYILRQGPEQVTFVITGMDANGLSEEDAACADYMEALLRGDKPDAAPFLERVRQSPTARLFQGQEPAAFPPIDLVYSLEVDRVDFAMPVRRQNGLYVMKTAYTEGT
jgi:2-phosphosulfolactate phosphatase